MATILIVEDELPEAQRMARILRRIGHTPTLAADVRAALQGMLDRPDIILLDLGLPDRSGEELLQRLRSLPETAHIPVVVITAQTGAAVQPDGREAGNVVGILSRPVSDAQLQRAVKVSLEASQRRQIPDALRLAQHRRRELVRRLIAEGPDRIAFHVYRRLSADRAKGAIPAQPDALTWAQIAHWAKLEGLLDEEQASLLGQGPPDEADEAGEDR